MPTIKSLEDQGRALIEDQKALVTDDSRTWSEKRDEYDKREADIKSVLEQRNAMKAVDGDPFGGRPAAEEAAPTMDTRSFGKQVTDSADYKAMVEGRAKAGQVDVKVAATITEGIIPAFSGGAGLAGQLNTPEFLPGITALKFQPLTIADLIPSGTTGSSSISYVIESAFQDLTATVTEGTKPQLDLTLARRQDNVTKIANVAKVTDEMFQDQPAFQSYLTNRMIFGVQRVEENQLLNGNGTPPQLQGILNRSGLATTVVTAAGLTALKAIEGIYNQITALRAVSFVEPDAHRHPPDGLADHPARQGLARTSTTAVAPSRVPTATAVTPSNLDSLWGLKAVITTAIAQGTVLVGGFAESAQVFRNQGISVQMTDSNVDDFINNLITLRAEERLALAVYRPAGFGKVTLTA
jgi:HK97 family phage major capsid protein